MNPNELIDMHCHVGLLGDEYPSLGRMSDWYTRQLVYKVFLFYGRLSEDDVSDSTLREAALRTIDTTIADKVVCLALDPVYDSKGNRREDLSHMWVDNDYILELHAELSDKVLLGASIHPYDPKFKQRVNKYIDKAVVLKWLPSAQQINLADERVRDALIHLSSARNGSPLPLLLHVGPEYAIPSSDPRTTSYDFLSWGGWDNFHNILRGSKKWNRPNIGKINDNLKAGLEAGAIIIFGHCGLPYFAPNLLSRFLEHSDFKTVRRFLNEYDDRDNQSRQCYTDLSACATPFRRSFFSKIHKLPSSALLFGSDFPTPVFELHADLKEVWKDLKAVFRGQFDRVVVPQDNLLDVNYYALLNSFPGHAMFSNFNSLLKA